MIASHFGDYYEMVAIILEDEQIDVNIQDIVWFFSFFYVSFVYFELFSMRFCVDFRMA